MKSMILVLGLGICSLLPRQKNPLSDTRWDGENGLVVYFTKSDTVKLMVDSRKVADALYSVNDSILTWRDYVKSEATCDTSIRGKYIFRIHEDVLTFRTLSDRCEDRANILQTLVLIKK